MAFGVYLSLFVILFEEFSSKLSYYGWPLASIVDLRVFWQPGSITNTYIFVYYSCI